jgi:DNA-binding MarR family transcriptional regulator
METMSVRGQAILCGLAQLHQWEAESVPPLDTVSGRFLYFKMMEQAMESNATVSGQLLKNIHCDAHLSERAIRLKLREFERLGYVESCMGSHDKRARQLKPTAKMLAMMEEHIQAFEQIMGKELLLIEKNHAA